ncbi:MAG: lytic transglycosylase domain-containing protein [Deltaproteobacteria bacterium]|nr:lytic transglycosylase domain-containing protein [Deltaproteobacteria bacterium]
MSVLRERGGWPALFILLFMFSWVGRARADIFVHKDARGVLHFTNVPTHSGFRLAVRESRGGAPGAPVGRENYDQLIRLAAGRHRVDPDLVRAVIKAESDFNSQARSHKGAEGLMQLMPGTARLHNVSNVYNAEQNIDGGVRHLRLLFDRFQGDLTRTLAAYNAGVKAVEKYGGVPPYAETKEYVRRVLNYYERFRKSAPASVQELVTR